MSHAFSSLSPLLSSGESAVIDQQPALVSWQLGRGREKARGNGGKESSGLHKLLWRSVSVEGTNELRGLPNKRRHLQQLSQLTNHSALLMWADSREI